MDVACGWDIDLYCFDITSSMIHTSVLCDTSGELSRTGLIFPAQGIDERL